MDAMKKGLLNQSAQIVKPRTTKGDQNSQNFTQQMMGRGMKNMVGNAAAE